MKKMKKIILLSFCILFLAGCGKRWTPEEIYEKAETRTIRSYNFFNGTNTEIDNFIIGTNKNNRLIYIYVKGQKGYKLQTINSNRVEIIKTDEFEPCIKGYFFSDGSIYKTSLDVKEFALFDSGPSSLFLNYRIYVPSNFSLVNIDGTNFDSNNFVGSLED